MTTDGSEKDRIKYGTASWVYGEELAQTTAMWWSPDGAEARLLPVRREQGARLLPAAGPDQALQHGRTSRPTRSPASRTRSWTSSSTTSRRRPASRSTCATASPSRTTSSATTSTACRGRRTARSCCSRARTAGRTSSSSRPPIPTTGACRAIVREEWPTGWVETSPTQVFLKDGRRFIWASERTGWRNYYLYDLSGTLITPLTRYTTFEAANLVKIDEDAKVVFLMARDGDNYLKQQLHRVGLDGKGDVRLTDPAFNHTVGSCMAGGGGRGGGPPAGPGGAGRLRHLAGQQARGRRLPDAQHAARHPPHRRGVRQGRGGAGGERPHEVQRTRPEEGRDVHLPRRRRQDARCAA